MLCTVALLSSASEPEVFCPFCLLSSTLFPYHRPRYKTRLALCTKTNGALSCLLYPFALARRGTSIERGYNRMAPIAWRLGLPLLAIEQGDPGDLNAHKKSQDGISNYQAHLVCTSTLSTQDDDRRQFPLGLVFSPRVTDRVTADLCSSWHSYLDEL